MELSRLKLLLQIQTYMEIIGLKLLLQVYTELTGLE